MYCPSYATEIAEIRAEILARIERAAMVIR